MAYRIHSTVDCHSLDYPISGDSVTGTQTPLIRRLTIERFRGIKRLDWSPAARVNVILGGGDAGKTTILEAIAVLLSPTNNTILSDNDYWDRRVEDGFSIEAVMSLPESCQISQQARTVWPWEWNGTEAVLPNPEAEPDPTSPVEAVYRLRARGTSEFDLIYEVVQPDGNVEHFSSSLRRQIGLVRLGGDDRNDRDLRLLQGSALDRLLSDKALRSRLGQKLAGTEIDSDLKTEAKAALSKLDAIFKDQALPDGLSIGLIGGQGFSVNAMIGLTATKNAVRLPLTTWGAGTRRLAALRIAASHQGKSPITVVDEVERGLEPYRQRKLISNLQSASSQTFLTTHSTVVISSAAESALWYVDSTGSIGQLPESVGLLQKREPEAFLARIVVIAEGITEVGFVTALLRRSLEADLLDLGVHVADGGGNDQTLQLLEGLLNSGLTFAGFADDEGRKPNKWAAVKDKLGDLLFRWPSGCLEENIISLLGDDQIEEFIKTPESTSGYRLRTLAERLAIEDKSFTSIEATASNLKSLVIQAATGSTDRVTDKCTLVDKELKSQAKTWFKTLEGGTELEAKVFSFGLWPRLRDQLLPFANAIRGALGLLPIDDLK